VVRQGGGMNHVPINAVTWTLGFIALYSFAIKSWRTWRRTKNPLAQMYFYLGLSFGTALFFFGVPGLFTQNLHVLRAAYFIADFFAQITMQVAFWLLWFLGLRNHIALRRLLAVTLSFSAVLIILQGLTSQVELSQSPYLIEYLDKPPVLIMKSIIYIAAAFPLGYFFLRQVPSQLTLRAKIKSLAIALIFIIISLAAVSNNIFDKGSDTKQSAILVAVFFVAFFLAQLPRPSSGGQPR
jgi:hypothetical protein